MTIRTRSQQVLEVLYYVTADSSGSDSSSYQIYRGVHRLTSSKRENVHRLTSLQDSDLTNRRNISCKLLSKQPDDNIVLNSTSIFPPSGSNVETFIRNGRGVEYKTRSINILPR